MEKIMKALLEAKYPTLNADVLLDIAKHTPNATIAIEKLCGLYTPYTVEQLGMYRVSDGKEPIEYKLISIDDWRQEVCYEYVHYDMKGYYVPEDLDPSIELTMDNIELFADLTAKPLKNEKLIFIKTGTTQLRRSTMPIEYWLKLA